MKIQIQLLQTSLSHVKKRVCRVERRQGKMLCCRACGQKIPSTPEGDIDLDQLEYEIAHRERFYP